MKNERYCLHIDDDPDEHELFAQVLANVEPGILCRTALDAGLALDNLKRTTHLPEMIFVDVNMPLMNGFEFISKMKEIVRLQEIPVVFYSTTTDQRQIAQALHHGALAFITKSWDNQGLAEALASLFCSLNVLECVNGRIGKSIQSSYQMPG